MEPIKLSIRKIVELALRRGDIDNRYADTSDSMLEGARAHRRIQKSAGAGYRSEVTLSLPARIGGIDVIIQGRADGVITEEDGGCIIDEIKTTTLPLEHIFGQAEQHMGQAKCYAYMYMKSRTDGEEEPAAEAVISVQLTYCQLETGEIQRVRREFAFGELEAFFTDLLDKYGIWMRFERDWKELRDESIRRTGFPFHAYRKGQRELAVSVYRTIERQKKLYVQAPTGIGKTISVLFPSIKAMAEGLCDKLFYLTAKTVSRSVAEDALRRMHSNGLRFKSVTLRAKEKICFMEEAICNPEYCPYAKGHYDRINEALLDLLENNDLITPEITAEYAQKHRVCPHETGLDAALWTDLVIGDYNHAFDPNVYLKRFFSDGGSGGKYVFLIDEAHNLADRVRDMYTCRLGKSAFYSIKKRLRDKNEAAKRLRKALDGINRYFIDLRKELEAGGRRGRVEADGDAVFNMLVMGFITEAGSWLTREKLSAHELHGEVLELCFEAMHFALIAELNDERFCTIKETGGGDTAISYFCLDPSAIIAGHLERAVATVMFSATLTPLPYFREILGGTEEDGILALPSPFEREQLMLVAHRGISTKYTDREGSVAPISRAIYEAVTRKKGNYLVFFPSYEYMSKVYNLFTGDYPQISTLLQQSAMDEEERAGFLAAFDEENPETLVGFCVLGGIFSEGIDLRGERLIGSIIVGVGLPKISMRQDLIMEYFDRKNGRGFDYAYVFPGMNKVLQAAGRVIRTEEDSGLVLLIDSRFGTKKYRSLFPEHWSHIKFISGISELRRLLEDFEFFR